MAKKGWFTELFISTKKTAQKGSLDNFHGADKEQASKWRLFGGKKKETATVEQ